MATGTQAPALVRVRKVWKEGGSVSILPLEEAVRKLYFADAFNSRDEARAALLGGERVSTFFATYEVIR